MRGTRWVKRRTAFMLWGITVIVAGGSAAAGSAADSRFVTAREAHIRQVFVYQGRIANDFLERYQLADDFDGEFAARLAAAEARMSEACTYLNQAAVAYLSGSSPGWRLRLRLYTSVDGCNAAAERLALLLAADGQALAASTVAP